MSAAKNLMMGSGMWTAAPSNSVGSANVIGASKMPMVD
jgi:hypothetical protein